MFEGKGGGSIKEVNKWRVDENIYHVSVRVGQNSLECACAA